MIKRKTVVGAAVAGMLIVVGCGSGTDDGDDSGSPGTAPAQTGSAQDPQAEDGWDACEAAEGSVVWYSAIGDNVNVPVAEAFEAAHPGIEVELLRLVSGQLQARYAQEREANIQSADVVTMSASVDWFAEAVDRGWFETELDLPALEEWPEGFYSEGLAMVSIVPFGVAYNTNLVSDPPQTWEDALQPEYADGALVATDPRSSPTNLHLSIIWLNEFGEDYLESFVAQQPQIVDSVVSGIQLVSSGSAKVALGVPEATARAQVAEGAPIGWGWVAPSMGAEFLNGVSTDTGNPNAARCFSNFLLTEEGQTVLNGQSSVSPLSDDLPGTSPMPEGYITVTTEEIEELQAKVYEIYGITE